MTTIDASDLTIGTEFVLHSMLAGSFRDLYVTLIDSGEGFDPDEGDHWTVLVVRDRTGREGTLYVRPNTGCEVYGS